jgi:hypothetical protein
MADGLAKSNPTAKRAPQGDLQARSMAVRKHDHEGIEGRLAFTFGLLERHLIPIFARVVLRQPSLLLVVPQQ